METQYKKCVTCGKGFMTTMLDDCEDCSQCRSKPKTAEVLGSGEFNCSVADVSQEMLNAGVKAAVRAGLIPEHAGEIDYLRNWDGIKAVISAALLAKH